TGSEVSLEYGHPRTKPTSGSTPVLFGDIVTPGSTSVPAEMLELLHFDLSRLVPYSPDALANWPAEIYSISPADASLEARQQALRQVKSDGSIGGGLDIPALVEDVVMQGMDTSIISFKLVLLPVWTSSYRYEGQTYQVVVNGNSGEVEGNVPRSAWQRML